MIWRKLIALALLAGAAEAVQPIDPPGLAEAVASGRLPPVSARVPLEPLIGGFETLGRTTGKSGGTLRVLLPSEKDMRLLNVWGYARLAAYDESFTLKPDLLSAIEVEDGRIFTLRLRRGHKWSDGAPFTAEDFRYWWQDVANNAELSPSGPPADMRVDGALPEFTVIDEVTVRFAWPAPNPRFLPMLAQARDVFIYRPAHYLKRFHSTYGDAAEIAKLVDEAKVRSWAALHNRKDAMYDNDNPDLPTLQPFVAEPLDGQTAKFRRNPFFHRLDPNGMQLPYIDRVDAFIVEPQLIAAKTAAGDSDLQAVGLAFKDVTALKAAEASGALRVLLWPSAKASQVALYPNLNAADPVWREVLRDTRFRQALSAAIDRDDINASLFFGLATPGNNGPLPQSPLYDAARAQKNAGFDLARANALLDAMGLTQRDSHGLRLLPDGRPVQLVAESSGAAREETDVLQLIQPQWAKAGIGLIIRPYERDVLRNRAFAGDTLLAVWSGSNNGVPVAGSAPDEYVPVRQDVLAWPRWGQFAQTGGRSGEAPDLPSALALMAELDAWNRAGDDAGRLRAWTRILDIHAEEQFFIGTVSGVRQPVVISPALRNVPEDGVYGWDPGAQYGIYRFDAFWLDR